MLRRFSPSAVVPVAIAVAALVLVAAPLRAQEEDLGNPEKAIKKFSQAVKDQPTDSESWYSLALAYYRAKKYDDAAGSIGKAVELNGASVQSRQLQGAIALKRGKDAEALAAYEAANKMETEGGGDATMNTVNGLAAAYAGAERWDDAIAQYKAALKLIKAGEKGDTAAINNQMGVAYLKKGDTQQAITWFKKNVEAAPDNAAGWYNLGQTYRKIALGNPGSASAIWKEDADAFKKAADMTPNDAIAQYFAGEGLAMSGRCGEAVTYFDRYLAADPDGKKAVAKFGAAGKTEVFDGARELKAECTKSK